MSTPFDLELPPLDALESEPAIPDPSPSAEAIEETPRTSGRKPRSDKGVPRGPRNGSRGPRQSKTTPQSKLARDLLAPWGKIATKVAFVAPTTSMALIDKGEQTIDALVRIADKHPRMREALEKAAESSDYVQLFDAAMVIGVAVMVDFGRIPPDSFLASVVGVTAYHDQIASHTSRDDGQNSDNPPMSTVSPFPTARTNGHVPPGVHVPIFNREQFQP